MFWATESAGSLQNSISFIKKFFLKGENRQKRAITLFPIFFSMQRGALFIRHAYLYILYLLLNTCSTHSQNVICELHILTRVLNCVCIAKMRVWKKSRFKFLKKEEARNEMILFCFSLALKQCLMK